MTLWSNKPGVPHTTTMAYVEIWKSRRLITRRRVDEEKAQNGCRIRLGSVGEVHLSIGGSEILGKFQVRMFEGEPPTGQQDHGQSDSIPQSDHRVRTPLDFSVGASSYSIEKTDQPPEIEGYQIIERLGVGGMGAVWRAKQLSTKRQVALKMMSSSRFTSEKAQARFEREVELTARLDHPNIASIFDSGLHHGIYYYAMEFIDGLPLDQYVVQKALSQKQILALMRTVCEAIEHAHLRGVMHRDLKPSNIMVSFDGQPRVVDFGLARTFLEEDSEALTISVEGEVAGTPAYMSPEQAAGHHDQVDTRTDVYSLGVILYRLLIGQSPYDLSASLFDVLQRVVQGKIRRPREICPTVNRELDAVLLKTIAHDQEERYSSAGALAEDIDNYLNDEPLDARVPTTLYFLRKKAHKHRVQVGIVFVVLITVFGIALLAYTKVIGEQTRRQVAEEQAETQAKELALKSEKLTWAELRMKILGDDKQDAEAALNLIQKAYTTAQDQVSQLNHRLGERKPLVAVRRIDLSSGESLASSALVREPPLPGGITSWTLETYGHRGRINCLVHNPDGSRLASAGQDGTIRIWNLESGQLEHLLVDPNTYVSDLVWSVDGMSLRGIAMADPALRSVWSIELGRIRAVSGTPADINWHDASGVCWSVGLGMPTRILSEVTGLPGIPLPSVWSSNRKYITALAFSPERQQLACGDENGTIWVLDAASGQILHTQPGVWCGPLKSVNFSPDGKTLATYSGAGTLCLWQADRWEPIRRYEIERIRDTAASITGTIAWAPDSKHIARVDCSGKIVEILILSSGEVVRSLSINNDKITCISWSSEGGLIAAATESGQLYLWDLQSDAETPSATVSAHVGSVSMLEWIPKSRRLVTAGQDGMIKIWQADNETLMNSLGRQTSPIICATLSRDGSVLASCSSDGIIRFWNAEVNWTSNLLRIDANDSVTQHTLTAACWSPDGTLLACGDSVGKVRVYDLDSQQWRRSFLSESGPISSLAWSSNGRVVLCGGADGTVRAWDATRGFAEHVVLLPLQDVAWPGIAVSAAGDYRGRPGLVDKTVYSVQTSEAQLTLSPADFKSHYGWVNEPWQVGLYRPGAEMIERIYVDSRSGESQDGKTWATAFSDLQVALSIAQQNTEIWVAAGIYRPDRGTGERTASFHLKNGVRLLGGVTGTETSSDQRDPNRNETILSGDLKGNDGPDFAKNEENSYHVVSAIRTDLGTVLDGFYITGGNANGPGEFRYDEGGGLYNVKGGLTLINCTFRSNFSTRPGAGMHHESHRSPLFLTDCIFRNNWTRVKEGHDWGGGIYIGRAVGQMDHCLFEDNVANDGGGAFLNATADFVLKDCTFIGNRSSGGGGAILAWDEATYSLVNCRFIGNSSWFGGGAVSNTGENKAMLVNCIFVGNKSEHSAGGMSHYVGKHGSGYARLVNCTFVGNSSHHRIGGFYSDGEHSSTLSNCVLWSNTDRGDSLESAQIGGDGAVIDHCCIQGWTGRLGGARNFGDDPLFVDIDGPDDEIGTQDDNLRLSPSSPGINAGDNSVVLFDKFDLDGDGDPNEPMPFDFEGRPRILNGTVDIGAYESG